ncbi:hypothetical protein [Kribbella sp. NPDC051770]|uniref:SRPBCC family protein n=1 Tax=Kribbella sp. NPDC051770 TaxID=3155413 RepID=UPI00342B96A0
MSDQWPAIELDDVQRFRVLAAAVPGASVTERVVDAPVERVRELLADPQVLVAIQADIASAQLVRRTGDRVVLLVRSRWGMRARLEGQYRAGWCWLQSRFLVIGMAAVAEPGGGTRVAMTGGVRVPGRAALVPVGVRRESRRALDKLEGLLGK